MASMADPSRLSNRHAEAAARIRKAMNADGMMPAELHILTTSTHGGI
jgi:hypothetical protein